MMTHKMGVLFMRGTYLKNVLCISVTNFNIYLSQKVLHLFQGHHVVSILVCFPHAADDPAGIWM